MTHSKIDHSKMPIAVCRKLAIKRGAKSMAADLPAAVQARLEHHAQAAVGLTIVFARHAKAKIVGIEHVRAALAQMGISLISA